MRLVESTTDEKWATANVRLAELRDAAGGDSLVFELEFESALVLAHIRCAVGETILAGERLQALKTVEGSARGTAIDTWLCTWNGCGAVAFCAPTTGCLSSGDLDPEIRPLFRPTQLIIVVRRKIGMKELAYSDQQCYDQQGSELIENNVYRKT